ncbi:LOW QUALITY PROTEIN: cysteine endopeptidase [Saitozyma sp. JCM 24511]|nr:LOW QUALITY PROTEIN: cysteine endopeptidase [Saitozyma sp. JCM 24511]
MGERYYEAEAGYYDPDQEQRGDYPAPAAAPPPERYEYGDDPYFNPNDDENIRQEGYYYAQERPGSEMYRREYDPPTGQPEPQGYAPTGAGYRPPGEYQHGVTPPYGQQIQNQGGQQRGNMQEQGFEYSQCNGRRKALLVGINYYGSQNQLGGCINDAHNVERFICERFGYDTSDIVSLTDDAQDPRQIPTRENIMRAMQWLVSGAQKDDALFFHYSGHGTQTQDLDGDEDDGFDEDRYAHLGAIAEPPRSHTLLVKPLPPGCRLTAIFDSCHSGSVMDLPYIRLYSSPRLDPNRIFPGTDPAMCNAYDVRTRPMVDTTPQYSTEGKIKGPEYFQAAGSGLMTAGMDYLRGDTGGALGALFGAAKGAFQQRRGEQRTRSEKTSAADVIMWSGCKDSQTSADTQEAGKATGAMSYAFIAALTKYPRQSYQQLLVSIRQEMQAGRYEQKPQLSACHRAGYGRRTSLTNAAIDVELEFVA